MKFLILILVFELILVNTGSCQYIINGGFEEWETISWNDLPADTQPYLGSLVSVFPFQRYQNPVGWKTNNSQKSEFVSKSNDAYSGKWAMKVKARALVTNEMPIKFYPNNFYYEVIFESKKNISDSAFFKITVLYFKKGNIIDTGLCALSGIGNSYNYDIAYSKDHHYGFDYLKIIIEADSIDNDYVLIDELFIYVVSNYVANSNYVKELYRIYSENHSLKIEPLKAIEKSDLYIYRINGQLIYSVKSISQPIEVPLNPGMYFYKISNEKNELQKGKVLVY